MAQQQTALVFGGTGFIGKYVVKRLAQRGYQIRVASRRPGTVNRLRPLGGVGQIQGVLCSLNKPEQIDAAVKGADLVVNLVGILFERGKQSFKSLQAEGPKHIAEAAAKHGVQKLVHISALGIDQETGSEYAASKLAGEEAVLKAFPAATILRPSLVIGPEDGFFNRFGAMAKISPFLPLVAGGKSKFQPLVVTDLADAVMAALDSQATQGQDAQGQVYELGGPKVYSFKDMLQLLLDETKLKRILLPLPMPIAKLQAAILQFLPEPPLTPDQLKLLGADNILTGSKPGFAELGIAPSAIETILPLYLGVYANKPRRGLAGSAGKS